MKRITYILTLVLTAQSLWAQTPDEIFTQANTNFRNGKYEKAISQYEQIEKDGYQSAELYYNLGNAYYKLNKIAPSIYNYEKSLMLNPHYEDAQNNLAFAQRMAIDIIEPMPKTLFQRINETIIYPLSYNTWAWISIIFAFITAGFVIAYYFSFETGIKRLFFILSFVALGLFLLTTSMGIKARHHFVNDQPAIVFASQVSVKSEPGATSEETFILHEGTKVQIVGEEENWYKIKLADGKIGWLMQNKVKPLK